MNALTSISLSGMNAAQVKLQASANNIANADTKGYRREDVAQQASPGGGVTARVQQQEQVQEVGAGSMEQDVVLQLEAKNAFLANLAVFKRANAMTGALLDTKA